jgi:glycosyltransferase involved in cell wall biosynthesis
VKLLPYVQPEELPAILAGLDVFAVPSHQEGLCIAALEAMACGVPVISTRCGGPEDFVRDGDNGWLVDAGPAAMGDAIRRVIDDRGRRRQMGICARQTIESHYSIHSAEPILMGAINQTFPNQFRNLCA